MNNNEQNQGHVKIFSKYHVHKIQKGDQSIYQTKMFPSLSIGYKPSKSKSLKSNSSLEIGHTSNLSFREDTYF